MLEGNTIYFVLAIVFIATLIRSAFGFGEALITVPLLAFYLPVKTAAPLAALISITVALVVTIRDWHHIHMSSAKRLIFSTFLGTPVGLLFLTFFVDQLVQAVLAVVIIAFSLFCLISQHQYKLQNDQQAWIYGFCAGILGGAYGMNGPPLVVYGAFRGWKPKQFRATLQGYFLPASTLAMVGYAIAGLWTYTVTWYYLLSLPVILLAILSGRLLNRRMTERSFVSYIYVSLVIIGIILLIQPLIGIA